MNKRIVVALLSVACIQSANAAWLVVENPTNDALHVRAESNGFNKGVQQQIVAAGATSQKFDSGAHRISNISVQGYNVRKSTTFGPKMIINETVPVATLTAKISIDNIGTANSARYNWGLGWKDADVSVDQMAAGVYYK